MADKMECPGCGAYSSSVLIPVQRGEPCPFCGLSASAIQEIVSVQRKRGDEKLKEKLTEALKANDQLRRDLGDAMRRLSAIKQALAGYGHKGNRDG